MRLRTVLLHALEVVSGRLVLDRNDDRRATSASQQRKAGAAWRDDGSLDRVDFRRDILPKLQNLPVRAIAEAMGASISHGSKVRCGRLVPRQEFSRPPSPCC
jgi:hypothetical protein